MDPVRFRCRALLFDLDGVLVDSMPLVRRAWRWWAGVHGLDPDEVARASRGGPAVETVRYAAPHLDAAREARRLSDYEAAHVSEVRAFPGVDRILHSLQTSESVRRWAVVTSGARMVAEGRLDGTRLPRPPLMITADDVVNGKPHPECWERAADGLGVDPDECLVLEDSRGGVAAARAAGMNVLAISSSRSPDHLSEAHAVVPSIRHLAVRVTAGSIVVSASGTEK